MTNEQPGATTGYVDVAGGGRLYYEVAGEGQPILFVHADVSDHSMWDEQVAAFAPRYRVLTYDKRGFGKTTSEDDAYSPSEDIAALLAHLGVTRTFVVGLSNGGAQSLDFTLEHPEMVDGLVVVAGGVSGFEAAPTEDELRIFKTYEELETRKDEAGLLDLGVHVWCDGPFQPEGRALATVRERIRETTSATMRDHHENLTPSQLEPPAVERLSEMKTPTLVLYGEYDFPATNSAMELLASRVPGAEKAVFETAHMVNMEQPAQFNERVGAFFATVKGQ
jgi:pimeloyl-ACP methyl ester carboxylesterase